MEGSWFLICRGRNGGAASALQWRVISPLPPSHPPPGCVLTVALAFAKTDRICAHIFDCLVPYKLPVLRDRHTLKSCDVTRLMAAASTLCRVGSEPEERNGGLVCCDGSLGPTLSQTHSCFGNFLCLSFMKILFFYRIYLHIFTTTFKGTGHLFLFLINSIGIKLLFVFYF